MCVSYGIIEGLTRISRISRILFRCKQRGFSFGLNGKYRKFLKIREIRVGKFNIPHSALKESITNLSKLAL